MANSDKKQAYKWRKKCGGWQIGYHAEAYHPGEQAVIGTQMEDCAGEAWHLMHLPASHSFEWVRECDLNKYPESKIEEPTK